MTGRESYTPEARAKYWAESVVHDTGLGLASEAASNAASVLLGLLTAREDTGTKLAAARIALDEKNIPRGKWRYVRMNQPAPEGDDFVVIAAAEYEAWRLRFKKDRDDQDAALKDAIAENAQLKAELDHAVGVIADRNKEIADLIHDLDFAKSATGEACATVAQLAAELEEATQARGRLRLWLEFIHLNSNDAKEFTAEALIGNHVPEGFEV